MKLLKAKKEKELQKLLFTPLLIAHNLDSFCLNLSQFYQRFPEKECHDQYIIRDMYNIARRLEKLVNEEDGPGLFFHGR